MTSRAIATSSTGPFLLDHLESATLHSLLENLAQLAALNISIANFLRIWFSSFSKMTLRIKHVVQGTFLQEEMPYASVLRKPLQLLSLSKNISNLNP
jgi:hypothetical protein